MRKKLIGSLFLFVIGVNAAPQVQSLYSSHGFLRKNSARAAAIKKKAHAQFQALRKRNMGFKASQGLDAKNREKMYRDYYAFYFTVPRKLIVKKRLLSSLGVQLQRKGYPNIINEIYQEPLLNYIVRNVQGKPIMATFDFRKLIDNKTSKLIGQAVFGDLSKLSLQDFVDLTPYKPKSLNELIGLANQKIAAEGEEQLLIQLFVPKDMAHAIAQARVKNTDYAIDQLMQSGSGLNQRLRAAQVILTLQPDVDYQSIKLFISGLGKKRQDNKIKELNQKINRQMANVVGEVVDAIKAEQIKKVLSPIPQRKELDVAPPVPPRDDLIDEVAPPLPPRDYEKAEQIKKALPPIPQKKELDVAPPVPPRDDLIDEVAPPLPPRDYEKVEQIKRALPPIPQGKELDVAPPVPPRDDLIDEVAPSLPPRDYEEDEVAVVGVDSEDGFGEQEDSLRDVLAKGLASKFAHMRDAEEEEDLDDDDFWQEEAIKWKEREAAKQKLRQEQAKQQTPSSSSYGNPMEYMIKAFEQRFPNKNK
jgi:hypothetical protein